MTHILVVDDKDTNLYYLEALLKGQGFSVDSAVNGAEALELARATVPQLVISDLLMPVMDGYTLLREWRADPALAGIPFVVYTATYTEPEDEALALELGADAFFLKPMEPENFIAGIEEILRSPRTAGRGAPPADDDARILKTYSRTLVRKLEEKTRQLEASNQRLQRDIARREAAEDALRISEERFRLLASATSDAAWDWDLTTGKCWWNQGCARLLGRAAADFDTIDAWLALVHDDDKPRLLEERDRILGNGDSSWMIHYRMNHGDGRWITVEERGHLLRDRDGKPSRMVGGLTDITQRLVLEEQVRQAQRMEAVGQLTGGIAHDFNNLLTVVFGNAQQLVEELYASPDLGNLARMIVEAAERGSDLTRRLLAFARKQPLSPRVVDIRGLVDDILPLLHRALGGSIDIQLDIPTDLPPALVDPAQLEHALLNLCINARDAMARGGELVLSAGHKHMAPGDTLADLSPGDFVLLSVTDSGTGIAEHHLKRIFEPFFSTKPEGKGSGLGLAMVYGFCRQSGGTATVDSRPGEGSTFTLYLPLAREGQASAHSREKPQPWDAAIGRGEHVLLVEDDDLVRDFARGQLESLGYRVTALSRGSDALTLLERGEPVDLLFTDRVMPAMSGPELVTRARQLRPDIPVLYTTGYAGDGEPIAEEHDPVLYKPYRRQALAKAVRGAMAGAD